MTILRFAALSAALLCAPAQAQGQPGTAVPPVLRRDLLRAALSPAKTVTLVDGKEVTLGPKQKAPVHLHPCPVVGVVTVGVIAFQVEGEPVRRLRAGDAFYEPAGARILRFDNEGDTPAVFTAFYLAGPDDHELIRLLPN